MVKFMFKKIRYFNVQLVCILLITLVFMAGLTSASEVKENKESLINEVKEQVIKELLDSGALQKEIDAGIIRFIDRQREARAQAPIERAKQFLRKVSVETDHIYGNPDAEISLIEYSDYECPFCKRFHPTAKRIVDSYKGKVNWVYRHFPLENHNPLAQKEAEASECAADLGGNKAFWKYSDLIYARTRSNGRGLSIDALIPMAVEIGLNEEEFKICLDSEKFKDKVKADYVNGVQVGITGTPGNILLHNKSGEIKIKGGAVSFDDLKKAIDQLLKG
jgi:protein-disulfide isomerase